MPLFKAKHLHSCDRTFTRTLALFRRMFISRVADFATLAKPSTAIATAGDHVVTLDTRTALGTTWALSGAIGVLLRCGACSLRPATVGASLVTRIAALLVVARHLLAMQYLQPVVHYMMGFGHACVPLRAVLFPVKIMIRVAFIGQVASIARLETCIG